MVQFYIGLHIINHADKFERSFISVNRLRGRRSDFPVNNWIMDSGAFTEVTTYGGYRSDVREYAEEIERWSNVGQLEAAVAQDWMCEPFVLKKTGLSVKDHQRLTIERYDALLDWAPPVPIIPVLQGYHPYDYMRHVEMYGDRLVPSMWVGVGSVCKRNANPLSIISVLSCIREVRRDLRLHGFGLKATSIRNAGVRKMLHTADSMAWSFAARRQGRNQNSWKEAKRFEEEINRFASKPGGDHTRPIWLI